MIAKLWLLCEEKSTALWIERVSPEDNIADLPTRDAKLPNPLGEQKICRYEERIGAFLNRCHPESTISAVREWRDRDLDGRTKFPDEPLVADDKMGQCTSAYPKVLRVSFSS